MNASSSRGSASRPGQSRVLRAENCLLDLDPIHSRNVQDVAENGRGLAAPGMRRNNFAAPSTLLTSTWNPQLPDLRATSSAVPSNDDPALAQVDDSGQPSASSI